MNLFIDFSLKDNYLLQPFVKSNKLLEAVLYRDASAARNAPCVMLTTPLICSETTVKFGLGYLVAMQTCDQLAVIVLTEYWEKYLTLHRGGQH